MTTPSTILPSSLPLTVTIPGCQVGEQFVTYTLMVSKGESAWTVRRRYQDFVKLHTAIRKSLTSSSSSSSSTPSLNDLPELPPKKMRIGLSKFAPDFVEERRTKLETYIQKILSLVNPEQVEALDDFLVYAEHWLKEAIESLADVRELQQVVKLLRSAAEAAAVVHQKRSGASGGAVKRRGGGGDSDDEEDDDENNNTALVRTTSNTAGGGGGGGADGPELLALLRDVVRMLREFAVMLRSQREDAEEKGATTAASNTALNAKLRGKQEDIADARHMLDALRQARSKECEKERTQLVLVSQQVRTVAAELRRVHSETFIFQNTITNYTEAVTNLRNILLDWEKSSSTNTFITYNGEVDARTLPSLSPLHQIATLCERTENIQNTVQDLLTNTFNGTNKNIQLPNKVTASAIRSTFNSSSTGGIITTNAMSSSTAAVRMEKRLNDVVDQVNNLSTDLVLSGPALSVSLLMQSIAYDNTDLLLTLQKISNKQYSPKPLPIIPLSSSSTAISTSSFPNPTNGSKMNTTNISVSNGVSSSKGGMNTTVVSAPVNVTVTNPSIMNRNGTPFINPPSVVQSSNTFSSNSTNKDNEVEVSAARLAVRAALAKKTSTNTGTPTTNNVRPSSSTVNRTPGNPFEGFGSSSGETTNNNNSSSSTVTASSTTTPAVKKAGNPFA